MGNLALFNFSGNKVRVAIDERNGEPFWVAKDICDALGYSDVSMTLKKLDDDEKLIQSFFVSGQNRDMLCVNESGLYTLILRSNKPEAKRFKKWVTSEVLPSIRKTGAYALKKEMRYKVLGYKSQLVQKNKKIALLEAKLNMKNSKYDDEFWKEAAKAYREVGEKLKDEKMMLKHIVTRELDAMAHQLTMQFTQMLENDIRMIREAIDTSVIMMHKKITNFENEKEETVKKRKRSTPALL